MNMDVDWYEVGKAERQLIRDVMDFENEMFRIDCTTYWDKDTHRVAVANALRAAIRRYEQAITKATNGQVAA